MSETRPPKSVRLDRELEQIIEQRGYSNFSALVNWSLMSAVEATRFRKKMEYYESRFYKKEEE